MICVPLARAALTAGILLALAVPAHAQYTDLGTVSGPTVINISGDLGQRPDTDSFTFHVASDTLLDLTSLVFTPSSTSEPWLDTLATMMFDWRGDIVTDGFGTVSTVESPVPGRLLSLTDFRLEAGRDYRLRVWAYLPEGPDLLDSGHYEGTLSFNAVAAPVPEPGVVAMMLLGLVGVGVARLKRR